MTNPNENSEIIAELRKMNRLLTVIAIEEKTQSEKVLFCSQLGMTHPQIGDVVGISANAVQKALKRLEKKGTKSE